MSVWEGGFIDGIFKVIFPLKLALFNKGFIPPHLQPPGHTRLEGHYWWDFQSYIAAEISIIL